MAPRPPAPSLQPPPELPAIKDLDIQLAQYLRTFALWCRNMFQDKVDAHRALPGILLQANDATGQPIPNAVYMLTVHATPGSPPTAPGVTLTLVAAGSGAP